MEWRTPQDDDVVAVDVREGERGGIHEAMVEGISSGLQWTSGKAKKVIYTRRWSKAFQYAHGLHVGNDSEVGTYHIVFEDVVNHVLTMLISSR